MSNGEAMQTPPKTIVVMPTYNERANLEEMIQRLQALDIANMSVLVIDDNSPDGTGELADRLAKDNEGFVTVIHRAAKMGLGTAYVTGFQWSLEHGADYIISMDADFSHSPDILPILIEKAQSYDVVVGSRFAKGGRLDERWGLGRRLLSWCGNNYSRVVTGVPLRDVTAGFKCFRKNVLTAVDLPKVKSQGFAFQVELSYLCHKKGFSMVEVPIYFQERTEGKSKMSLRIILEAFWRVLELRTRS